LIAVYSAHLLFFAYQWVETQHQQASRPVRLYHAQLFIMQPMHAIKLDALSWMFLTLSAA